MAPAVNIRHPPNWFDAPHAVNHYERLKVTQDAPPEVIRAAYRALANRLHPDRNGPGAAGGAADAAHEQMAALNAAYEVLIDPSLRRDYDASLSTARNWRVDTAEGSVDQDRDPSAGVVPADLVAPVTAWAPDMKQVLLAGVTVLALAVVGVTWYLQSDSTGSSINAAMGDQLSRHEDSMAVEAARRGEMPALNPAADGGVKRPTVEELARMSDEELVAAMPALDGQAARMPPQGRVQGAAAMGSSQVHPLDGSALALKVDAQLLGSSPARSQLSGKP